MLLYGLQKPHHHLLHEIAFEKTKLKFFLQSQPIFNNFSFVLCHISFSKTFQVHQQGEEIRKTVNLLVHRILSTTLKVTSNEFLSKRSRSKIHHVLIKLGKNLGTIANPPNGDIYQYSDQIALGLGYMKKVGFMPL